MSVPIYSSGFSYLGYMASITFLHSTLISLRRNTLAFYTPVDGLNTVPASLYKSQEGQTLTHFDPCDSKKGSADPKPGKQTLFQEFKMQ